MIPTDHPSSDGVNGGRDPHSGRFLTGHKFAKGNPHAARVARLRSTLLNAVTADDIKAVWGALTKAAKSGDVAACRVFLDRVYGKDHDLCTDEVPSRARAELIALLDGEAG